VDTLSCWMDLTARFCDDGNETLVCVESVISWRADLLRGRVTLRLAVYHQSVHLGEKPLETRDQSFFFCQQNTCDLSLLINILSDYKMGLSFTFVVGPRQHSYSRLGDPRDSWPYFTISDSRRPKPGGPGPRIYIPQEQGGPIMPPGIGSLFFFSYDLQGYGGGTRIHLHTRWAALR
jgi:hypothetical protein